MESKRTILKRNMNKSYCSGTRFEYLDEDERPLIYKAMQEYAEKYHEYQCALAENTPTSSEQLAAPAVVKSVCPNCGELVKPVMLGCMCPSCACDM